MTSPPVDQPKLVAGRWPRVMGQQSPAQAVEDSILLRVLVQFLVTLGICSVTVAASGVAQTSLWNLMAIPLSALGAFFSWQRRRSRNVAIKFFIAIGMLLALAAFFSRLVEGPGDTRLVLAELLIQLQVLHSFDLPRRKDLGYSMMIGLVLLGVAATVSQTLVFGPLLLLFLVVALPVLVLDYRSRLGLWRQSWQQTWPQIAPRRLVGVLLLTLGLGLTIFMLLPRLPGYQISNFPVSSTINLDTEFDGSAIINPGYVGNNNGSGQNQGSGGGSGDINETGKLEGPGVVDQTSYYGFNRQMNQNLRGDMVPKVVMRVRSQSPGFWRVVAFDRYTGQGWDISRNDRVVKIQRPSFSYQTILPRIHAKGRTRQVIQTYTMVEDFSNLVPALYQPRELYFPTQEIAIDLEGGIRAPLSLEKGITYTVVSEVPYRDRTLLGSAGEDYPDNVKDHYLEVPGAIAARVRATTEELLATAPSPLRNPYEKSLYLAQTLKQRYQIQPELPFFKPDQDLVEAFLYQYGGGYPDHFSTVLTIMLRSIGIPARLAAGFSPGEFNPFTGFYVVQNVDAYAITEVYFPGYGWFAFDPIPGNEVLPPSVRDYQSLSVLRQFWNWVAGWLPSPIVGLIDGTIQVLTRVLAWAIEGFVQFFTRGWVGALLGLGLVLGLSFLGWLALQGLRLARRRWQLTRMAPMERIYQQLLDCLGQRGCPKQPTETPLEYGQRLYQQTKVAQAQPAGEILHAYVRWRYGGEPADLPYLQQQLRRLKALSLGRQRRSPVPRPS